MNSIPPEEISKGIQMTQRKMHLVNVLLLLTGTDLLAQDINFIFIYSTSFYDNFSHKTFVEHKEN